MRAEGNRRLIDQTSGLRANQITSYLIVDLWELLSQFIEIDILSQDPHPFHFEQYGRFAQNRYYASLNGCHP